VERERASGERILVQILSPAQIFFGFLSKIAKSGSRVIQRSLKRREFRHAEHGKLKTDGDMQRSNDKISFAFAPADAGRSSTSRSVAIPPPSQSAANSGLSRQGYSTLNAINHSAITSAWGVPKKRAKTEEE